MQPSDLVSTEVSISDLKSAADLASRFHKLNVRVENPKVAPGDLLKQYTELKFLQEFLTSYDEKVLRNLDNEEVRKQIEQA